MTAFDIIVLLIVGAAAIGGFARGLVSELMALAAWIFAVIVIRFLHGPLYEALLPNIGSESGAAVLAFAILLLVPYAVFKALGGRLGAATRNSVLGPVDRVLGFGFGAVKGMIVVLLAFSILVLGYDTVWGAQGRPTWMTQARTYPLVDASSRTLVELIEERRARFQQEQRDAVEDE